ncbi:MAG: FAD-binding oxidoreductase, partial [Bacteroidota bacterium]
MKTIDKVDINFFSSFLNSKQIIELDELKNPYGKDETENLFYKPDLVLIPHSTQEISEILKYCNTNKIVVTPRGAGTGLSGGALPIFGGIILSLERLNKIIEIDVENMQATVEPGIVNEAFQIEVQKYGLFYPPDPASKGSCFLGGNIAHSSGGPRAVKYGTTRDYILNLEVVLPTGEIIWTGANTLKYSTGYNLTHLFIGSEGTLGVVTKIVVKLIPFPKNNVLMLVPFFSANDACKAVNSIFLAGLNPSALEFMERDAIDWTLRFVENVSVLVEQDIQAHLLIEYDGNELDSLNRDAEKTFAVLENFKCGEILFADNEAQKNMLWKIRRSVAEAVKNNSFYKEEDTVVPRAFLPQLLAGVKSIGEKYGFKSVCYGHAGDGNLHVNIIKGNLSDEFWESGIHAGIEEIFILCKSLNGTISGEHGIGLVQKRYMHLVQSNVQLELQRGIKNVF